MDSLILQQLGRARAEQLLAEAAQARRSGAHHVSGKHRSGRPRRRLSSLWRLPGFRPAASPGR